MIKIGDFGISRILMGTSDMATTFTGTPYYMSPEILKHEGYNSKSDIWYVGNSIIYKTHFSFPHFNVISYSQHTVICLWTH